MQIERAHVAGHSSGAAVAVQLALDDPARVQSLALLELSLLSIPAAARHRAARQPHSPAVAEMAVRHQRRAFRAARGVL